MSDAPLGWAVLSRLWTGVRAGQSRNCGEFLCLEWLRMTFCPVCWVQYPPWLLSLAARMTWTGPWRTLGAAHASHASWRPCCPSWSMVSNPTANTSPSTSPFFMNLLKWERRKWVQPWIWGVAGVCAQMYFHVIPSLCFSEPVLALSASHIHNGPFLHGNQRAWECKFEYFI